MKWTDALVRISFWRPVSHLARTAGIPLFILGGICSLEADVFTVTRTNNTGPGSLPVVLSQANAAPGNQIVEFAVGGVITLAAPLPVITNNLTVNGRVDTPVIISGGGSVPIFTFAAGTTNFLNRLSLINGRTAAGGGGHQQRWHGFSDKLCPVKQSCFKWWRRCG